MLGIYVEDWMIQDLDIKGSELLAFALIHNCTQSGDGCWYGGSDRLALRLNTSSRNALMILTDLEKRGLIERFDAFISEEKKKACRSIVSLVEAKESSEKTKKISEKTKKSSDSLNTNNTYLPLNNNTNNNISIYSEIVEKLYKLYPSSDPITKRTTRKSKDDKVTIVRLLKKISPEKLEYTIKRYLEESEKSNLWIQNFSKFLEHLPDYDDDREPTPEEKKAENDKLMEEHLAMVRNQNIGLFDE